LILGAEPIGNRIIELPQDVEGAESRNTRAMGVSPHRYVSRMRPANAMADIAAGKLSLAEKAFKAGFLSQASFTRAFYRVSGLTPGEYLALRRQRATAQIIRTR
jgi:AraC-like DNA-binding protein